MANVGFATLQVIPSMKGIQSSLTSGITGPAAIAGTAGGTEAGKKFGGSMLGSVKGFVGPLAAITAGTAVFGFLKGAQQDASDLNETANKSAVIFGDQAGAIDAWASSAATSAGLSKQAALDAAAGFGDMFTQLGFAGDQAAAMSTSTVQLAADLGSFNNLPTEDVSQRISAAFRGEYDSLQTLIPNINAARVQTEAMAMTGKKNASELTAQEKAAAVLAIVNHDGARAVGDFARTSDQNANSQKIMAARYANLKTSIGKGLIPVMGFLLKIGMSVIGFFTSAGEKGSWLSQTWSKVFATVKKFISDNQETFKAWWASLKETFTNLVTMVMTIWESIVAIWKEHGDTIMAALAVLFSVVSNVFHGIMSVIGAAMKIISGVIKVVTGLITGDWSAAWDGIKQIFSGVWDAIKAVLTLALDTLKTLMSAAWDSIKAIVGQKVGELMSFVSGIPGRVLSALGGMWDFIKDEFGQMKDALITKGGEMLSWVQELPDKIVNFFASLPLRLLGVGKHIIEQLWAGITEVWDQLVDWFLDKLAWLAGLWPFSPAKHGPLRDRPPEKGGANIVKHLAEGMRSQEGVLRDAAMSMASAGQVNIAGRFGATTAATRNDSTPAVTATVDGPLEVHVRNWPRTASVEANAESSALLRGLVGAF